MTAPEPVNEPERPETLDRLLRLESDCRKSLINDPCNLNKRLELAWVLFIQGVIHAGQEAGSAGSSDPADHSSAYGRADHGAPEVQRSRELFRAALRETISVEHLGREEHLQVELDRLNYLIGALAGPDLIRERARRSVHIRMRLLQDLASGLDDGTNPENSSAA